MPLDHLFTLLHLHNQTINLEHLDAKDGFYNQKPQPAKDIEKLALYDLDPELATSIDSSLNTQEKNLLAKFLRKTLTYSLGPQSTCLALIRLSSCTHSMRTHEP